jgi:kynurenine formamidase
MTFKTIGASALALTLSLALPAFADSHANKSPFGPEDQAGRSNLMTPAKAMEATKLMKTGTVLSLGRDYEAAMPLFGSRAFALRATGGLAGGPFGDNKVIWNDDFLATEIGQVGTQFDGLSHIGIHGEGGPRYYNGLKGSDIHGPQGMKALGVEHVKPFFTRGVLIDMVGLLGRNMKIGEEISAAQLQEALDKQGTAMPAEGDVVIFHTGWGDLWIKDNEKFNAGAPGIGLEAAQVLIEAGVALVGSDTWPVEVVPNPNSKLAFPVHQEFLTKNGIFIHENLASERLAEAGVYEFAYIYAPVPIVGATGSPGAPLAVY